MKEGMYLCCMDPACGGYLESVPDQRPAELLVLLDEKEVARVRAEPGLLIGRGSKCGLKLGDNSVSSRHAQIVGDAAHVFIKDLGSANGTWVNGARVLEKSLRNGDRIQLGLAELVFSGPDTGAGVSILETAPKDQSVEAEIGTVGTRLVAPAPVAGEMEDLRRANDRLLKALDAVGGLSGHTDEDALVSNLLDKVFELFPAERAVMLLTDPQGKNRRAVARNRDGSALDESIAVSRSLAQKVLTKRTAMVVADALEDPRMPDPASVVQKGLRSILVAPVTHRSQVLGLLWGDVPRKRGAFNALDLPVFVGLAVAAGATLAGLRLGERARAHSVALSKLSTYLPRELIREVMTRRVKMPIGGEQREVTVLFSDLRGFTAESERLPAQQVVAMLNAYFWKMVEVVYQNGGMLDKFIGDAVMALWGVPLARSEDPVLAVRAALGMQTALADLNRESAGTGRPKLAMGVGLHSGPAAVGNIGSPTRMDWTAVGATVNLASRIEGTTGAGDIHVSETTYQQVKHVFRGEALPPVKLKNVQKPVQLYRIIKS
ncbi:MAG: FHA domain-containing protein [Candidatus Wallbacteria bacterium]|nr:FHA domain-containing protein [Candidatus Wallbacteria bacterium]